MRQVFSYKTDYIGCYKTCVGSYISTMYTALIQYVSIIIDNVGHFILFHYVPVYIK